MSYSCDFTFNNERYTVVNLAYSVNRDTDESGRIATDPQNALIKVYLKADHRSAILESMVNNRFKAVTGKIIFNKSTEEGKLIELKWSDGFVLWHEVLFNATNNQEMLLLVIFSARIIQYGQSKYDGNWPE